MSNMDFTTFGPIECENQTINKDINQYMIYNGLLSMFPFGDIWFCLVHDARLAHNSCTHNSIHKQTVDNYPETLLKAFLYLQS